MHEVTRSERPRQARANTDATEPWLLVFDLDGTLIDSSRDLIYSVNAALAEVHADPLDAAVITSFIGDGATVLIRRALAASFATNPDVLAEPVLSACHTAFLRVYRAHKLDTTRPYAGVLEALDMLRHRVPELQMAILTNKPVGPSRAICDALELSPYFFVNYGGDSFATKKPEPLGLRTIVAEAKIRRHRVYKADMDGVVMIGDAPPDVVVARAVGARSLGCLYGLAPDALRDAEPDMLVTKPAEWVNALFP